MILADTSIWVDHLRRGDRELVELLGNGQVACHPFIIGELALGMLRQRQIVLTALSRLPQVARAKENEVLEIIERRALFGNGVGYVDAHLLASVAITPGTLLWTRDKRLRILAERLGCHASL